MGAYSMSSTARKNYQDEWTAEAIPSHGSARLFLLPILLLSLRQTIHSIPAQHLEVFISHIFQRVNKCVPVMTILILWFSDPHI